MPLIAILSAFLILGCFPVLGLVGDAFAFYAQSQTYILSTSALTGGGAARGSASFRIEQDSVGEPCVGKLQSGSFILQTGLISSMDFNSATPPSPPLRVQSSGGTGNITVTASSSGCTASSNMEWITVISRSDGAGGCIVDYSASPNLTGSSRTGTFTVAGQTVTILQAATKVTLSPQVLMAGFDPILLDFATTRIRVIALVREGNQPIGNVSITDNAGSLAFAMDLIGSLLSGDLLYSAELSIGRGDEFSIPNLFGSQAGQILIKAVDTTGLSHSFPTLVYGNNPDLVPNHDGTPAPLFEQRGCKRLMPQVLMAGFEPSSIDFNDTELKIRAMVREGARPIQDVSLKQNNNSAFNLILDVVETLENGDRLYEKAIVFQRGAFGEIAFNFDNLWGGIDSQFMIEVKDDAGQVHSFPDIRRGDYRTINAAECWSDQ